MAESKHPNGKRRGRVYLVGAGPGDVGLITLRGLQCLRCADVVLYDYLANEDLLQHARPEAERICLGRHGGERIWSQAEINQQLVLLAEQGKQVVRLKGGDPAVFARAAEEVEILERHGVEYEVVPGITVSLAASSHAGIPLTHRDHASAVALITGQEKAAKDGSSLDYSALARFPGTLVFYMGVTTAENWTGKLIGAGKPPDTPVAIVRRCSLPDQSTIRCSLDEVARVLSGPPRIRPPAVVIIGAVAALSETRSWFERRPLFGRCVLVTRPREQAEALVQPLGELGAQVLIQPAIDIGEPEDWGPVDRAIADLHEFDWLVFSSANGVRFLLERLLASGADLRKLGGIRLATIGPGTAHALSQYRLKADLTPETYRAESLAAALVEQAAGKRFLLARASRGREVLAEQLEATGGDVRQVVVYESTDVVVPERGVLDRLNAGEVDWVTVTSSAIARSLVRLFGDSLRKSRLISISPITSATLRELGHEPALEAKTYTMEGVIETLHESV